MDSDSRYLDLIKLADLFSPHLAGDDTNIYEARSPSLNEIYWKNLRIYWKNVLEKREAEMKKREAEMKKAEMKKRAAVMAALNIPWDETNILPALQEIIRRIEAEMPASGLPLQSSRAPVPIPGDHTNILPVQPDPNKQPQYGLQFMEKVQNPSFTNHLVRNDNGSPIKVAIHDTSTQSIISPDNILSSAKVRLTVLNAEFVENEGETLSRGEFNQSMLKPRERKGPILTGRSCIIQLKNGVGTFENIVFNDNSSWTKSGFRLGVMVVSDREEGYFNGERVLEGVSEPFRVKDRRMKASQKPDRLKLTHKVQSLKKVGKDRASLLRKENIKTVEDFLKFFYNDGPALREILGIKSESGKEWDSMVEHAMQCADEFHAKNNALNNSSQPRQALVHPTEGNLSLSTNDGRSVVGCGSSEQNPSDEDLLEFLNSLGDFVLDHALVHPMEGNQSLSTNGGRSVDVGWESSEPNSSVGTI